MSKETFKSVSYMQELGDHITEYLDRLLGSPCKDKFDAVIESGQLIPIFKDMGDGMVVGKFKYKAVFSIEDFPGDKMDPYVVMARVLAWIQDHDREREKHKLSSPEATIDAYNNGQYYDMDFDIDFIETITAVPAPDGEQGDVTFAGQEWIVQPYEIYIAEDGEVTPGEPET